jgi:hypothetical protein
MIFSLRIQRAMIGAIASRGTVTALAASALFSSSAATTSVDKRVAFIGSQQRCESFREGAGLKASVDCITDFSGLPPHFLVLRHVLRKSDDPFELAAASVSPPQAAFRYDEVVVGDVRPERIITTAAACVALLKPQTGRVFPAKAEAQSFESNLTLQYLKRLLAPTIGGGRLKSILQGRATFLALGPLDRLGEEEASFIHWPKGHPVLPAVESLMNSLNQGQISSCSEESCLRGLDDTLTAEQDTASLARLTVLRGLYALQVDKRNISPSSLPRFDEAIARKKAQLNNPLQALHETLEAEAAIEALRGNVPL